MNQEFGQALARRFLFRVVLMEVIQWFNLESEVILRVQNSLLSHLAPYGEWQKEWASLLTRVLTHSRCRMVVSASLVILPCGSGLQKQIFQ